jgi:hypothetical protein
MWFATGPAAVTLASTILFAIDAVARRWQLSERRRLALALVGALAVANVVGLWGHPEDCVALACVVWAALIMDERGRAGGGRAALLLGIGIAFQPMAVLGVAPVLTTLGWRRAARRAWLLVAPSVLVVIPPLLADRQHTIRVLMHQPVYLAHNSLTPFTRLAPTIAPGVHGGGPTRVVAIVLGAALAVVVCRRRHDLGTVLTMTAVAFFLRVLLETELNWYYLWPVPAICLLLALRRSTGRFVVCTAALVLSMVLGDRQVHHIVLWWPALMATVVAVLLSIGPSPREWAELVRVRGREAVRPVECQAMEARVRGQAL